MKTQVPARISTKLTSDNGDAYSMARQSLVLLTLLALIIFAGCGQNPATVAVKSLFRPSPDKDVTTDPSFNFAPFAGTVWKTRTKTAIAETKRYTGATDIDLLASLRFDPADR